MWLLYQQSKLYGIPPSEILKFKCGYVRYDFDKAITLFGNYVESRLNDIRLSDYEKKQKNAGDILLKRKRNLLQDILNRTIYTGVQTIDDVEKAGYQVVDKVYKPKITKDNILEFANAAS